ncbi:MAG: GlcNAc-PI de-N-acetylase [Actinomycetales bacterium]|nr:GlcNAc-PI de-N-acetylase [Actinomycetales bacterium]
MPGLLAVHAHPDDETLWTGALLATWARTGGVELVTCTRGERGEVIGEALAHLEGDGPALAVHREGELAAALAALGVARRAFLDELADDGAPRAAARLEDSGMVWVSPGVAGPAPDAPASAFSLADLEATAAVLARRLAATAPDVVVTYGPDGGYGHPDHVRAHQMTMRAVARHVAAGGPAPVVLWAVPAHRVAEVRASGGPRVEVPVAPVVDQVAAAMRAHATQVQAVTEGAGTIDTGTISFALSNDVPLQVGPVEVFEPAPGPVRALAWPAGVDAPGWPVP